MQIAFVKNIWTKVPLQAKQFIVRAVLFFLAWLLLYQLVLKPTGFPDIWLTDATSWCVVKFAGLFYTGIHLKPSVSTHDYFTYIILNGKTVLRIADGCNALDLMVLYACFLFCLPTSARRVFSFLLAGIVAIFILNVLRCSMLIAVYEHMAHLFDFAHKYLFTAVVYCFIFWLWILYAKKYAAGAK